MAKLKERVKKFHFPPFSYELTVVVSSDILQSINNRAARLHFRTPDDPCMAACVYGGESLPRAFMFLPAGIGMNSIVHECSHVLWFLFHFHEIKLENELFAYHIGHLSEAVSRFVWAKSKK